MATPRVTIDQLPDQAIVEDTNYIIVQDSGVTKKLLMSTLRAAPSVPLNDHLSDTTDAHDATSISTAVSGTGVDGADVQSQLGQLTTLVNGKLDQTVADGLYVNLTGDTMTGPLILVTDPTGALEAATKQYVDQKVIDAGGGITQPEADALYVNLTGDTMTGPLTVDALMTTLTGLVLPAGEPTAANRATPKSYVDGLVSAAALDPRYVKKTGDTLTGQLSGITPTAAAHLARKDYVDLQRDSRVAVAGDTMTGLLAVDAQLRGKSVLSVSVAQAPCLFGIYNKATDINNAGTRLGYVGTNTGNDTLFVNNETGTDTRIVSGSGVVAFCHGANVEDMRVGSSTTLMYKTAANLDVAGYEFPAGGQVSTTRDANGSNIYCAKVGAADVNNGVYASFRRTTSQTQVGSITTPTATTTAYNTGSDETLKENITPVDDELAEWMCYVVQPWMYNWIAEPDVTVMGYVAQRVAAAWPGAIDIGLVSEPDPEDPGSTWMMDYSKMIPIIHAAWQSSHRKLQSALDRLTAVEAHLASLGNP
jgi:Chaperone of endosialidase